MDTTDPNYTSLSEFETSSDSDWLDISSRASEDSDSVAAFDDSDREDITFRPASRQSQSSVTSSRGGVVEGWEGLIEDTTDEIVPIVHAGPELFHDSEDTLGARSPSPMDDPEDEKVKAGLEQSMMSTLSSSRPNSLANSVQASVRSHRDLRLSFPDPLTSSAEQSLHSSFQDVSAPESSKEHTDAAEAAEAEDEAASPSLVAEPADPGLVATPEVLPITESVVQRPNVPSGITPDFLVAVYGSPVAAKDAIIDTLLRKWAAGAGLILSCSLLHAVGVTTRVYIPKVTSEDDTTSRRFVSIVDKTEATPVEPPPPCPSIALVLLPSVPDIQLSVHTLYLPVVLPSSLPAADQLAATDYLLDAEQQWELLGVPSDKLTTLRDWSTAVIDEEKLDAASPAQVITALKPLFKPSRPAAKWSLSTNAILLAILSVVIGYVVKGTTTSAPVPTHSWAPVRPHNVPMNRSAATSSAATSVSTLFPNSVLLPPSVKDMQVMLVNSVSPMSDATPLVRQVSTPPPPASTSAVPRDALTTNPPTECGCGCGMVSWTGKMLPTDLIVRPAASASVFTRDSTSVHTKVLPSVVPSNTRGYTRQYTGKGKEVELGNPSLYALSTRLAGSLSEYLDFKTVFGFDKKDIQELVDAVQVLYDSIGRQTALVVEQSRNHLKKLTEQVKEGVSHRNTHAKTKARQLKEKGRRYLSDVRDRIRGRTERAKEHAKAWKDTLKTSETEWRARRRETRQLRKLRRWEKKKCTRHAVRL